MLPCYLPSCRLGVVYTIFVTHPLHCPRWEHFAPGLNTILGEVRIVLLKPAPKGRATHSCSVCEVGFIHTFHSTVNWELGEVERGSKLASSWTTDWAPVVSSSTQCFTPLFTSFYYFHFYFFFFATKVRKNLDICKFIVIYFFGLFQCVSTPRKDVVPLQCLSKSTSVMG